MKKLVKYDMYLTGANLVYLYLWKKDDEYEIVESVTNLKGDKISVLGYYSQKTKALINFNLFRKMSPVF